MRADLDAVDLRILALLQRDAAAPVAEIAEQVGLSQSPCWRRVHRLEEQGFIRERVAVLDRRKLGFTLEVFVQVRFEAADEATLKAFERAIGDAPEVVECHMLMGEVDFLLRVVATDVDAYERFLRDRLVRVPGVRSINSSIAVSCIKDTRALPVELLAVEKQ